MKKKNFYDNVMHADCLEALPSIETGSIDMVLCDLPYGTTQNKWDSIIPLEPLWKEYKRVIKKNGVIVLTCAQPFTSQLGASNLSWLRYSWVWKKTRPTGHLDAKRRPMREHEDILVFACGQTVYNPQGLIPYGKEVNRGKSHNGGNFGKSAQVHIRAATGYPRSILEFAIEGKTTHPTQKPVALFEYLIRTYTNVGGVVLDNAAGSGTTGVACVHAGRNFILIEKDALYVKTIHRRLKEATAIPILKRKN